MLSGSLRQIAPELSFYTIPKRHKKAYVQRRKVLCANMLHFLHFLLGKCFKYAACFNSLNPQFSIRDLSRYFFAIEAASSSTDRLVNSTTCFSGETVFPLQVVTTKAFNGLPFVLLLSFTPSGLYSKYDRRPSTPYPWHLPFP